MKTETTAIVFGHAFTAATVVVSIYSKMLQCLAKYSLSSVAAIILNYWSFERGFRVSLANTLSKTWVGKITEKGNNIVRCMCICGYAARKDGSEIDTTLIEQCDVFIWLSDINFVTCSIKLIESKIWKCTFYLYTIMSVIKYYCYIIVCKKFA